MRTLAGNPGLLAMSICLALAVGPSARAQLLDPAEQSGQPFDTEGESELQDDTVSSGPPLQEESQRLGEIDGIEIDSNADAPEEANQIMDDSSNTGMPPLPSE